MSHDAIGADSKHPLRLPNHLLDVSRRTLTALDGRPVDIRPQALELICLLAQRPGEIISKRDLFAQVWPSVIVTDDSLVQAVSDARRAIGDETHTVIQTVPRRGYRLMVNSTTEETGSVKHSESQSTATPAVATPDFDSIASVPREAAKTPETATSSARLRRSARWWWLAGLAASTLVAFVLVGERVWQPTFAVRGVSPDRPPIAALSFRDPTASAEDQNLACAHAEELTGELARNADLGVVASYSAQTLGDQGYPPQQIARQLGARYLVDVQLRRHDDAMRLSVQLIDGLDGRIVWTDREDIAAVQIVEARDAIVDRIAGSLHSSMRRDQETSARSIPASLDVYAMTLSAISLKHRINPVDIQKARTLLERVVALDPNYAPGWLYLGYVNTIDLGARLTGPRTPLGIQQAIEQVEHSIRLNANLPPAYSALAFLYTYSGRYREAERAARRCLQLGPSDSECSIFLAATLVAAGKAEAALPYARQAMASSPLPAAHMLAFYGQTLWANREFGLALDVLSDCLQQAPSFVLCRVDRMLASAESGKLDLAATDAAELQRTFVGVPLEALVTLDISPEATQLIDRINVAVGTVKATAERARR